MTQIDTDELFDDVVVVVGVIDGDGDEGKPPNNRPFFTSTIGTT
jgi:hypothetical protein